MTGRSEVKRLENVLDATFERSARLPADPELQSDFAKHLCVLVSGFLEKAVAEMLIEHARNKGAASLVRYVESNLRRATNMKSGKLKALVGAFDPIWTRALDVFLVDETKDAVESVVALRNKIAHGESVGVTLVRVKSYYAQIKRVVDKVANLCVPPTSPGAELAASMP